jgi:hypothetical protein
VFLRVGGRERPVLADPRLASARQEAQFLGSMKITHLEFLRSLRSDSVILCENTIRTVAAIKSRNAHRIEPVY